MSSRTLGCMTFTATSLYCGSDDDDDDDDDDDADELVMTV